MSALYDNTAKPRCKVCQALQTGDKIQTSTFAFTIIGFISSIIEAVSLSKL